MDGEARLNALEEEKRTLQEENGRLKKRVAYLEEQFKALTQRVYGRRSERFENPDQQSLFDELLTWPEAAQRAQAQEQPEDYETIEYKRRKAKRRGPKPLPEGLPRDRVEINPPESKRICDCCGKPMERVGEKIREELTIKPPEFRVTQFVQGQWCCPPCMNKSIVEPLPPRPIENGRPSPSLLAYITTSKYADHLPLYRQEQIFKRYGIHLPRSTMDTWFGELSGLLVPIVNEVKRGLLERSFIQSDDTPIQVLDRAVKGKSRRCYIWAYCIPAGEVVYHFTPSRSGKWPLEFLDGFSGHLQCDGYEGYGGLFDTGRVVHIGCLAHIRRKFLQAKDAQPERVEEIIDWIRKLYLIEDLARERKLSGEDLVSLRKERCLPILETIESKIGELAPLSTPKSNLGKAVNYAQGQWKALLRYIEVPEAQADNNWCENAMRPVVLGRKNFMFLGSPTGGGERAEVFYTLVQSCRRLGVDPFAYLTDVIARVSTHPASRIWELTPRGWKETAGAEKKTLESVR